MPRQKTPQNNNATLPSIDRIKPQSIPEPLTTAAARIKSQLLQSGGRAVIRLAEDTYRQLDAFEVHGQTIQIGSASKARPTVAAEPLRRSFAYAASLAAGGSLELQRFDMDTAQLRPVKATLEAPAHEGVLCYLPSKQARVELPDGKLIRAFSLASTLTPRDQPIVSFVANDERLRPVERAAMTAAEAAHNRLAVTGIYTEDIYMTSEAATAPFQEAVAIGLGNALGALALGWQYKRYQHYIERYSAGTPLMSSYADSLQLVAPHFVLHQTAYDQLAAGEITPDTSALYAIAP